MLERDVLLRWWLLGLLLLHIVLVKRVVECGEVKVIIKIKVTPTIWLLICRTLLLNVIVLALPLF